MGERYACDLDCRFADAAGKCRQWAHSSGCRIGNHRQFIDANLSQYGAWSIKDVCISAACIGTVVATLSGKAGRVEVWNNGEVWFVPKGLRNAEVDEDRGAWYMPTESTDELLDAVRHACGLAGIPADQMALNL